MDTKKKYIEVCIPQLGFPNCLTYPFPDYEKIINPNHENLIELRGGFNIYSTKVFKKMETRWVFRGIHLASVWKWVAEEDILCTRENLVFAGETKHDLYYLTEQLSRLVDIPEKKLYEKICEVLLDNVIWQTKK